PLHDALPIFSFFLQSQSFFSQPQVSFFGQPCSILLQSQLFPDLPILPQPLSSFVFPIPLHPQLFSFLILSLLHPQFFSILIFSTLPHSQLFSLLIFPVLLHPQFFSSFIKLQIFSILSQLFFLSFIQELFIFEPERIPLHPICVE